MIGWGVITRGLRVPLRAKLAEIDHRNLP